MSEAVTAPQPARQIFPALPLSLRLALRELRGGISGFYIFVACIALGATAIAAVGTLSTAIQYAISREGRTLLGGDFQASVVHRQATQEEYALLTEQGSVSSIATLRSMARLPDGSGQALVQVKAVDNAYPLYGAAEFENGRTIAAIRETGQVAVERGLLEQLGVEAGADIALGDATVTIGAIIAREPDRLTAGITLGPRVLMSLETLERTGLSQPGSLINWRYRIRTPESGPVDTGALEPLSESGFRFRDYTNPSPSVTEQIVRLSEFLTLVGLTVLLIGGIGVANAVTAFIERKRRVIAAYKALGATGNLITRSFLLQVMIVALLGIVIGLTLGSLLPFVTLGFFGDMLPIRLEAGIYPEPLILSAAYGLLITLIFILWPLGRARQIRAGELLREGVDRGSHLPPRTFAAASVLCAVILAAMAVFLSAQPHIAAIAIGIVAATFALFAALGYGFQKLAARLPRPRKPELALALSSIAGPAGLTRTVTLSLGAGLTLLTVIAATNASLTNELQSQMPERAPSHFFLGIKKEEFNRFSRLVTETAPGSRLESAPMLRGKIVEVNGVPTSQIEPPEEARWVLNGDRGLTFAEDLPSDSAIVEGEWWPNDYAGEPLVSFESDLGRALGLNIGDTITFNVLGRNITARLANLRTVEWSSLNINFVMIFSPNTLAAAPYNMLATLNWPQSDPAGEVEVVRAVTAEFPTITSVRVRDAIENVNAVLAQIFAAVRAAGSLTLLSGVLVLAGALGTARARRIYEAVVLKVLGATRGRILLMHMAEYLILGLATALVAAAAGALVAYLLLTYVLDISFSAPPEVLLQAAGLATIFMVGFGLFGTARVLNAKSAPYLRAE